MTNYIGELAALATALCWSISALFSTHAGRAVGPLVINRLRLVLSVLFLSLSHLIVLHTLIPPQATPQRLLWLSLSGFLGLTVGDALLFQAYIWIGPRLGVLLQCTVPIFSTILAWLFFRETLTWQQISGITLTLSGIVAVIMERSKSKVDISPHYMKGILLALSAAACQSTGLLISKQAMGDDLPALSATFIRMTAAATILWLITLARGEGQATLHELKTHRQATFFIFIMSIIGTFIGIWLSMVAVQHAKLGIASTLMNLMPIFMMPLSYFFLHEAVSKQAIAGTIIAVMGVAILFMG